MRDTRPSRTNDTLGQLLLKTARLYNELATRETSRSGAKSSRARSAHTAVLSYIDTDGTTVTALANRLGISKQAVSQLIDDMEANGFISRAASPHDKRAKLIQATARGRQALAENVDALSAIEHALSKNASKAAVLQLQGALTTLLPALESLKATSAKRGLN